MRPAIAVHAPGQQTAEVGSQVLSQVTSQAVIADMQRHDIGFTADNYAVWHGYMTGAIPSLKRAIDIVLSNGMVLDDRALGALYARHFNQARDARSLGEAIRRSMLLFDNITVVLDTVAFQPRVANACAQLGQALAEINRMAEPFIRQFVQSEERIAQLEHSLDDARREATTDGLTNVANRRAFDAELRARAGEAMNDGTDVGFVLIDIDHFKQVNDRWGHPVGDSVLKALAGLLSRSVRASDRVARYGGEEFAVILPGCDASAALAVAETLRGAVADQPVHIPSLGPEQAGTLTVTISAGVSCYQHGESLADWLGRADMALYRAKNAGRNRVVFGQASIDEGPDAAVYAPCNVVPLTFRVGA